MTEERVQRRLAAILAADVVGYSRLMRDDEAGTLEALKNVRKDIFDPKADGYGGRIFKTTGDGFLIEFSSAVDALQFAVDVQQAMAERGQADAEDHRLELRIGLNVGDVIVEGEDLYGDGVNVASRVEGLADAGGICLSGSIYEQVQHKLDLSYEDMGAQSLKNIADPVRVFKVNSAPTTIDKPSSTETDPLFRKPAVAVLPFENLSGDPEQEYFADGLSEDIITSLSLWKSFPVIARNSTFAYKGKSSDIREVGETLGARYVLEGSVRKAGNRVRVTAQLINAETGHHIWAERYDRELEDIFALQDEITERIAGIIEPTMERAERHRVLAKPPSDFDAWDYVVRGLAHVYGFTKESTATARGLFQRAIELDPHYARAHNALATTYARDLRFGWTDDREESLKFLFDTARRAIALDETDSDARTLLVRAYHVARQPEAALAEARRAIELNPNNAFACNVLGVTLSLVMARHEEGIPWIKRALELDPLDPQKHSYLSHLAFAQLCSGQYETAVESADEAIREAPEFFEARVAQASAYGYLGRPEDAQKIIEGFDQAPQSFVAHEPRWGDDTKAYVLAGLRKAGFET